MDTTATDTGPSTSSISRNIFTRFKRSPIYAALLPITFLSGLASGFLIWGRDKPQVAIENTPVPEEQAPVRLEVSQDNDPKLGSADAPVEIIEFSDFSCPFCKRFHQETFPDLMDTYGNQIQFVYRDFPVVGGGQIGFQAAQAANCAAEQVDYWVFHDALFSGRYNLNREGFNQYALELGLDITAFEECLVSERYADEVNADFQDAIKLGVTGTPTFFINGIPLVGAQPLSRFALVIDSELAP